MKRFTSAINLLSLGLLACAAPPNELNGVSYGNSGFDNRKDIKSTMGEHEYTITDGDEVKIEFSVFSAGPWEKAIHLVQSTVTLHDLVWTSKVDSTSRVVEHSGSSVFPSLLDIQSGRIVSGPAGVECETLLVDREPLPHPDSYQANLKPKYSWPYKLPFDVSPMVIGSQGVRCIQEAENAS